MTVHLKLISLRNVVLQMNTFGGGLDNMIQSTYHGYREEVRAVVKGVTVYDDEQYEVSFKALERISHIEEGKYNGTRLFHLILDLSQNEEYVQAVSMVLKIKSYVFIFLRKKYDYMV